MKIDAVHPLYTANVAKWTRCRDAHDGQDAVKAKGQEYLPKLSPQQPSQEYGAFLKRALFYESVGRTVDGYIGAVSRKEHLVTLPRRAEFLMDDVTGDRVGLTEFIKESLSEILITGRCGLLVDLATETQQTYVTLYRAEDILNWSDGRVVLSETAFEPDGDGVVKPIPQIRELHMVGGAYTITLWRKVKSDLGKQVWAPVLEVVPTHKGRQPLTELPWIWASSVGAANRVVRPPLLGLVDVVLSHFVNSASLEHGLHFSGNPTLYVTGVEPEDKPKYIGSQMLIVLKDPASKCGYAEFNGAGLGALENVLAAKEEKMARLGAAVFGPTHRLAETAMAARIRTAGENSVLAGIITAVEVSIEEALRVCARWIHIPEDEIAKISVKLNRNLCDVPLDPQTLTGLVAGLQAGAVSLETFLFTLDQAELLPPNTNIADEAARLRAAKPAPHQSGAQQNDHA